VGNPQTLYAWRDAATHRRRRRCPQKAQAGAADGFAILEVVIAFTMLVIILIPAAALFSTVIRVSANTRNRVEAANLAAEQIDVGRATSFGTLAAQASGGTVQTSTSKEGGITFTIAQSASWVNESTNACGGTGNGAAGTQPILAMTETVTWPDMGSTHPIVAQTDVAPPAGYYSNSLGNLAVDVVDSNGAPVVGASVTITGPTDAGPILTGATGCAFAAFLNPGAYAVSASLAGYVDMDENLTASAPAPGKPPNIAIGAGSTVGWTLHYAPAAQVPISYTSTPAQMPAPTTTTTLAGPTTTTSSTTTTPGATTTTTTPPGTVTYPTNGYPVTVNDAAYLPAPVTYSAPLAGPLQLWPYSNGYDIYPGGCADNDPAAYSTVTPFTVSQGVTSPDTLQVYGVSITATSAAGPLTNIQVTATDTSPTCSAPNNAFSFSSVGGNSTVIAIPLGTFSLQVTGTALTGGGHSSTVTGTILLPQETGAPLPPQNVTLS
jgi:Tfp pilus assembly protein PilV